MWLGFVLFRGRRYGKMVLEEIRGIPTIVFPGVFHPGLFLSTSLLLDVLDRVRLKSNASVLDLGTGTGICAIFVAKKGAQVTATDISPLAVRCARVNVLLNSVESRVRVVEGDLFQPVEQERFDLIIVNPPYYRGKPRSWPEYAWRGDNVLGRFVDGLGAHIAEGARALISASTELDLPAVREKLRANGFEVREIGKRRLPGETIYVYECVPSRRTERLAGEGSESGQQ